MNVTYISRIASELQIQPHQVAATAGLLAEGATVPFIARYRKEVTGQLDEVVVMAVRDRLAALVELDARRDAITKSLAERSLLTDALKAGVAKAETLAELEDLFAPYRPKRRTRAMIAHEAGLGPLADVLFAQLSATDPATEAVRFVDATRGVADVNAALSGARDIIAERVSDDATARAKLRELYWGHGTVRSKVLTEKQVEGAKFKDYFDWTEPVGKIPSHRLLAIRRGEAEGVLLCRINPPEEEALGLLEPLFVRGASPAAEQVRAAVKDGYKRLLGFALEAEVRIESKKRADTEAIRVFADNLRELLLAAPLGRKTVLAIDPGFRTGCKLVILDRQGKLLHHDVVYPSQSEVRVREAGETLRKFVEHFKIEAIAIGNGTAGRETETFVRGLGLPKTVPIVMVNESGASIYSASDVARTEFPDHDLTVRGAVSIGRRLMDPLAELVKLDPKSIGVGQYQHDVDQSALKRTLDDVVVSSVNRVGVELNTASEQLLAYVSGIGPTLAASIVAHRNANGPFVSRQALLKVARLGPKAFEQCAGFLRVRDGAHPLDGSAVHPESYELVDRIAHDLQCGVGDLLKDATLRTKIQLQKYVSEKVGLPTLTDILGELAKPGRDPRQQFETFAFAEGVNQMADLKPGQKLPGIVTNVTAFGAFIDVGVHQDGLAHVSQLADKFIKDPNEAVKVGQRVQATVLEVDLERKRISLSLKARPEMPTARPASGEASPRPGSSPPPVRREQDRRGPAPGHAGRAMTEEPKPLDWFSEALAKGTRKN